MANEIRAGQAYVEIFLKGNISKELKSLSKELKQTGDNIASIGKGIAAYGAAMVAPLILAATRFAVMGDEVERTSQRTGIAVESLTALKYAAEQSEVGFDTLETGIKKMQKTLFEAGNGVGAAKDSLKSLGLTSNDLKGLTPDEQFLKLGDALAGIHDPGAKAALAMELFGKSGTDLLPLLANGSDGIKKMMADAKALGLTFSNEDAEAATRFHEVLGTLGKQFDAITFQVGAAVAQALQPFAKSATQILASIIAWAKENKTLVISVLAIGAGLLVAGAATIGFGVAVASLGAIISGVLTVVGAIATGFSILLNPIILIGAGLVALGGYFLYASGVGTQVLKWLGDKFGDLLGIAKDVFGGISDALAGGDIQLAGQILWTGLQIAWAAGVSKLKVLWLTFEGDLLSIWASLKSGFADVVYGWGAAIAQFGVGAYGVILQLVRGIQNVWSAMTDYLGNKMASVIINSQIETDITKRFGGGKTLDDNDARSLAGREVTENTNKARADALADNSSLSGDALSAEIEKRAKATNDGIIERYKAKYSGKVLSDDDINGLIDEQKKIAAGDLDQQKRAQEYQRHAENDAREQADKNTLDQATSSVASWSAAGLAKAKEDRQKIDAQIADLQTKIAAASGGVDDTALSDLKKQLAELKTKAKTEKDIKETPPPKPPEKPDGLVDRVKSPATAAGLFNAAAIQSLRGGAETFAAKTAKATQETSENTKKLLDKKGAVFAP